MEKFEYELVRSRRKSISLEIDRKLRIIVRAPLNMKNEDIEKFVASKQQWLLQHYEIQRRRIQQHPEPTPEQVAELVTLAKQILPERVEHYARLMQLYPQAVTITGARTRFGSCSGKNRICFSWRLMQYPKEAVDYVVVHELAHIKHKNHSKDFYALVEQYLPDYRQREKMLK
jgi:hypothetical protein